jgi:endonuclease III
MMKNVVIGKASFSLAAGESKTVKVKITNAQAKKILNQGKTLKAQVKGAGVETRSVMLRLAGVGKK